MLAKGVRPVALTEKGRAAFVAALEPVYKGAVKQAVGAELLEKLKNAPDAPAAPVIPRLATGR